MSRTEVNQALWLLNGIENGTIDSTEAYKVGKELDPVTLHFVFRFLRDKYPPSHQHAQGVIERMVELTSTYSDLVSHAKKGEKDSITEWFDDAYSVKEFLNRPEQMIDMLVEKIES